MYRSTALLAALVVTVAACASDPDGSVPESVAAGTLAAPLTDASTALTTRPPVDAPPATERTTTTMAGPTPSTAEPLYTSGDIANGLQPFIDQAVDDLAARLDVEASAITTHAAVLVVWPDASLGCPQPDMFYAQVMTDGSVIELEHDGRYYRYHTGGNQGPFICPQPLTTTTRPEPIDLAGDDVDD